MAFLSNLSQVLGRKNKNKDKNETNPQQQQQQQQQQRLPLVAPDSVMDQKQHGTSATPVQEKLRWSVDRSLADRICNFNRHKAEHFGYFEHTAFPQHLKQRANHSSATEYTFYDSNTGHPLFHVALQEQSSRRTWQQFLKESRSHGWPSFRDEDVNWEHVRCLSNGECVSLDGTHLGHNLPDRNGNRYCINLVSIAGKPPKQNKGASAEEQAATSETTEE